MRLAVCNASITKQCKSLISDDDDDDDDERSLISFSKRKQLTKILKYTKILQQKAVLF